MSLYHFSMKMIGKSAGHSAVAAAAYRSGSLLTQVITDKKGVESSLDHDYSTKKGVGFSKIFAPSGLSDWCYERQSLWQKVETAEKRINSQFAREIVLGLQIEFSLEENIEIISEFIKSNFVAIGMIADVNIHYDNPENPHAHIMLTTRELLSENGISYFGKKNKDWNNKAWLLHLRKNWADLNNKYFKIYDIDKTITHESYRS